MIENEKNDRRKKKMNAAKKAKASFLQQLRGTIRVNEESSSVIAARTDIPPDNNEIQPKMDATSDDESSYENAEIERVNVFDEHAKEVEDINANCFSTEEEHESAGMIYLKT